MSIFTTRNEHAAFSFMQLMGRGDSEEIDSGGWGGVGYQEEHDLINTQCKDKMRNVLNFEV